MSSSSPAAPPNKEAPYLAIARKKQAQRQALLPSKWMIPSNLLPHDPPRAQDGPQNVLDVASQVLSRREMSITDSISAASLLSQIRTGKLSSVEVIEAFCHRAAVAQQLTNCLTEILFERAVARARELDDFLHRTGRLFGPLHGLPVSVKDTFDVEGVDSSLGLAALCFKPARRNAALVDMLLSLGCVVVAKTNVPQTLASLDSVNHIFGRTMNPLNRRCTAGGSSGGEGVLVAMRGCMVGWGTDVGGSIRIPAMCNGVYGLKPSVGRVPFGGQASLAPPGMARVGVQAVAGPVARSVEDIDLVMKEVVPRASLWGEDCVMGQWPSSPLLGSGPNGELVVGVLRGDGNCELLPPITNVLNEVSQVLKGTGKIKVVELPTTKALTRCQSVMSKLMGVDGAQALADMLESMKEPLVPWMQSRFRSGKPKSLPQVADIQAQRSVLEYEMSKLWYKEDEYGRRKRTVDIIICPLAAHPTPPIEGYNAVGYTSSWVLLDYPAAAVPVREVRESDLQLGKAQGGRAIGSWDERCRDLWNEDKTDRKVYLGTKLSIQFVVPRLEDERLVQAMTAIDSAIKGSGHTGRTTKL